jgi:hypothetical protein
MPMGMPPGVGMGQWQQAIQAVASRAPPGTNPAAIAAGARYLLQTIQPGLNADTLNQWRMIQAQLGFERDATRRYGIDTAAQSRDYGADVRAKTARDVEASRSADRQTGFDVRRDIAADTDETRRDIAAGRTQTQRDIEASRSQDRRYGVDTRAETSLYGTDVRAGTARDVEASRAVGRRQAEEGRMARAEISDNTKRELQNLSSKAKKELAEYLEAGRMERAEQARTSKEGIAERAEAGKTQRAELSSATKREIKNLSVEAQRELEEYKEAGRMTRAEQARTSREDIAAKGRESREGIADRSQAEKASEFATRQNRLQVNDAIHNDQRWQLINIQREQLERQIRQGDARQNTQQYQQQISTWRAMLDAQHKLAMEKIQSVAAGMSAKDRAELIKEETDAYSNAILSLGMHVNQPANIQSGPAPPRGQGQGTKAGRLDRVQPKTPEEAMKLPAGTIYQMPDGQEMTR